LQRKGKTGRKRRRRRKRGGDRRAGIPMHLVSVL